MLAAIYQSVFRPSAFCQNAKGRLLIEKYGWFFIALRWLYYSLLFALFRDYHGAWKPFADPPFGLSLDTYATLQQALSVVFGFFLMSAIAGSLVVYLRIVQKGAAAFEVLNVLGITFFLPFVILQVLDLITLTTLGWRMEVIIPLHTLVLLWEAVATVLILDARYGLRVTDKVAGVVLIMGVWIAIAGQLWR